MTNIKTLAVAADDAFVQFVLAVRRCRGRGDTDDCGEIHAFGATAICALDIATGRAMALREEVLAVLEPPPVPEPEPVPALPPPVSRWQGTADAMGEPILVLDRAESIYGDVKHVLPYAVAESRASAWERSQTPLERVEPRATNGR